MKGRGRLWGMVAVLLVAAALRLFAFGEIPPGLYRDEAYHGLDALDVLRGHFSVYFAANNGREPLFIYLIAPAVGLLGKSPFALRLAALPAGLLTVAATGALGRELFSRRVGLLAAAVLAVTLCHVHLSRVGFRAILLPLFIALAVRQGARAVRTGSWRHWLAAGVLYGLSFYTYTAARFTPVALAAFGMYVLRTRAIRNRQSAIHGRLWRGVGLAALAALVIGAPLVAYTVGHPEVVLGRLGQVSVFNPAINGGDLWRTLGAHTLRTMGMFFVRGDRIWRHNVPWRPVFDPLLGGTFVVGFLVALRRLRRHPAAGFVLIWTAVMALPTLLAEDAPHFLRGVGVLPLAVLLPALGLDWLADRVRNPRLRLALPAFPLLFGLCSTAWAYFGAYARDPVTGYWFERGSVALAGRINEFLGVGWGVEAGRQVYLDPTLWENWPQVRFLVAAPLRPTPPSAPPARRPRPDHGPVAVFVWPHGDWEQAWALLPAPAEVTVEEGPLSQGDRDLEPFTTYVAFFATSPDPAISTLARFSGGVELLGVDVTPVDGGRLRVRIRWRATAPLTEDYTVFLHYLRDGERIAQADTQPAQGYYPTTLWHPGDIVNDNHDVVGVGTPLPGHDALRIGLWHPESGAVLPLLDEAGNPAADWIEVPVDG